MTTCKITAHKFQDVRVDLKKALAIRDLELSFDQMQADDEIGKLISFVSLHYHEPNGLLYCGLTSFANQVLISFDPDTKQFVDLEYQNRDICERFDVKIHRSFEADGQGNILMAIAGLHDPQVNPEAEGGRLLRLYPDSGEIEVLGRPVPGEYIQTFAYDRGRRIFYGNGYPLRRPSASIWTPAKPSNSNRTSTPTKPVATTKATSGNCPAPTRGPFTTCPRKISR